MILLRRLSLLLTLLSLVLATIGYGVARGQAPVAGQMVICTGSGIVTVTIDDQGNPVSSHTLCPDAALGVLAAVAMAPPAMAPVPLGRCMRAWPLGEPVAGCAPLLARGARGPPIG